MDLITTSVHGLVHDNRRRVVPNKYNLFVSGSQVHALFKNIHPTILESQIKNFANLAQGRYIREFAYVLLALNFCEDTHASHISKRNIKKISDFKQLDYTEYIQSSKSIYLANKSAYDFCKLDFATDAWANFLASKMLTYGYFCRYLDIIELLQRKNYEYLKENTVYITQLKNLLGPFDHRVKGSGPDFIQETFKSWAFLLGIIDLDTGGKLSNYTKKDRLDYLKKHTGYISGGKQEYAILRNLKKSKIKIKLHPEEEIRMISFMRLVNLEGWRRQYNSALYSALRRLRILYFLNYNYKKEIKIGELYKDEKLKSIISHFKGDFSILWDLIHLECGGLKFQTIDDNKKYSSLTEFILEKIIKVKGSSFLEDLKGVETKSIYFEAAWPLFKKINTKNLRIMPLRKFDINNFNKYCPQGEWIEWIQKN
ncbi:hypothetical protein J4234_04770 [Candidatus Woesearchaeota archaeon]|nr:hypothetical protein [Candidatus Woesearchaeota archaeon]